MPIGHVPHFSRLSSSFSSFNYRNDDDQAGEQSDGEEEEDGDGDMDALEHHEGSKRVDMEEGISSSGLPERWDVLGLGQAMVTPPQL